MFENTAMVRGTWRNGVTTLTLDRANALNALGGQLLAELLAAWHAALDDERTRAIVLTGAGRAFSAGGDVTWFGDVLARGTPHAQSEVARFMEDLGNPMTQAIVDSKVPVVAAVNGACVGGAVGIALAADVVLAARSAYFLIPQVSQLGAVPDLGATWLLPRALGRSRALGMALLGDRIDAVQAERWGLVWACVDDAELALQAQSIAERLAAVPAAAVRDTRRLIDTAAGNALATQLVDERTTQRSHVAGDFFKSACARFRARSQRPQGKD